MLVRLVLPCFHSALLNTYSTMAFGLHEPTPNFHNRYNLRNYSYSTSCTAKAGSIIVFLAAIIGHCMLNSGSAPTGRKAPCLGVCGTRGPGEKALRANGRFSMLPSCSPQYDSAQQGESSSLAPYSLNQQADIRGISTWPLPHGFSNKPS
jgi:hypothetical protein